MTKKYVSDMIQIDELDYTLIDDAISFLQEKKLEFERKNYINVFVEMDYYYDSSRMILTYNRLETDEEYSRRLEMEKRESLKKSKQIMKKIKKDIEEYNKYLKLKEKYEKD